MAKSSGGHPAAVVPVSCLTGALPALIYPTPLFYTIVDSFYEKVLPLQVLSSTAACTYRYNPACLIYPTLLLSISFYLGIIASTSKYLYRYLHGNPTYQVPHALIFSFAVHLYQMKPCLFCSAWPNENCVFVFFALHI